MQNVLLVVVVMLVACGSREPEVTVDPVVQTTEPRNNEAARDLKRFYHYTEVREIHESRLEGWRARLERDHVLEAHFCDGGSEYIHLGPTIEPGAEISVLDVVQYERDRAQYGDGCYERMDGFHGCTAVVEEDGDYFVVTHPVYLFPPCGCIERVQLDTL